MNNDGGERTAGGMTRRELLRLMGVSSGAVMTGSLGAGCAELWERQPVIPVDQWHKSVCRFCGTGCGVMVGVRDNRIVDVKGDKAAHNRGRVCIKGIMNRELLYVKDRALHPMIRHNGKLRRADWDDAMALVAEKFNDSIETHGPDSVAYYGSGQLFTQETYTANKLFKAGIGTNNVDGNPRLCMASAAVGYVSVFGSDEPMGCYADIDHADCFFVTGSNMAECHPVLWERIRDRKKSRPETFIIVVDPRRTRTVRHADLHLAIRPGTDIALYNAMLNEMLRLDLIDEEMVNEYIVFQEGSETRSFEEFKRHIDAYSPEEAARICDVSAAAIREAAYRFGASGATMSLWTMGLNQQSQGTAANRLVNAMHLVTGHIGRPGATPFSLTGQPNAGGGVRDTGSLSHLLPGGRVVANRKHREEMEDLWQVPRGSISPNPGHHAVGLFEAMERGDINACLILCTNPAHSLPNAVRFSEAMKKPFLVVGDSFHPTKTTELADVVLPAAMWMEKQGVFSQSERRYHYVPKVVDPPGEARSDLEIIVELAERLGHGELVKARTYEDVWDEWRKISRTSYYNFYGITYERLKKERGLIWPVPDDEHAGTCRRYIPGEDPLAKGDKRFDFYGRPDGRAVVWLHEQKEALEPVTKEYPLTLTTGRVLEHWHTKTMTGRMKDLKFIHDDFLEINPKDAHRYGIMDGARVMVQSRRGSVSLDARVTHVARPGVVFSPFHSIKHLVNNATNDVYDPFSRQPEFKLCAVRVETTI